MLVKDIVPTDFLNYKKPSMYIAFPFCSFKCEKECGIKCCQNSSLAKMENKEISIDRILQLYEEAKPVTKALLLCGLEPLDSFDDVLELISKFREKYNDDIVIYTGYKEHEIFSQLQALKKFPDIIIKFGRYIPNKPSKFDDILGVKLASDNQYGEKIS